ncbi:MAG TPA: PQQ-binding-like beta-propeller repeat protein [Gemmatimonadaceae bacterium]
MPRDPQIFIYVGIKNSVIALDDRNGMEIWRTRLRGSDYVTVLWDGEALVAANSGEVWSLDPKTGAILWHNGLKGLGRGLATLASSRRATSVSDTESAAAKRRRDQQAAAGATTAAIG